MRAGGRQWERKGQRVGLRVGRERRRARRVQTWRGKEEREGGRGKEEGRALFQKPLDNTPKFLGINCIFKVIFLEKKKLPKNTFPSQPILKLELRAGTPGCTA